jgi:hypothetical protein
MFFEIRALDLKPLLLGLLIPGAVSLVLFLILNRWRGRPDRYRPISTLALALGYLSGQVVVAGWPTRYPGLSTEWIPLIALAATVGGLAAGYPKLPSFAVWSLRLLLLATLLFVLLRKQLTGQWTPWERSAYLVGLLSAGLILFASLDRLTHHPPRIGAPLLLSALAAASSMALVLSGSLLLGQLNGILAATLAASVVAACFLPEFSLECETITLIAALQITFWICGYFYSDLPALSAGLLVLGPVLVLLEMRWLGRRLRPWQAVLVHLAVILVPLGLAIALSSGSSAPDDPDAASSADYDF